MSRVLQRSNPPYSCVEGFGGITVDFVVDTLSDVVDATDRLTSLREAIASANSQTTADTIVFQAGLTGVLRLTQGEIEITDAVTIDGASLVTITGDADDDEILTSGLTNVAASGGDGTSQFNGLNIVGTDGVFFDASISANVVNADPELVLAATVATLTDDNTDGTPEASTGVFGGVLFDNGGPVQAIALLA